MNYLFKYKSLLLLCVILQACSTLEKADIEKTENVSAKVKEMLQMEKDLKIDKIEYCQNFANKVENLKCFGLTKRCGFSCCA